MENLITKIREKINADDRFTYHRRGSYYGMWSTRKKDELGCGTLINLKKNLAKKGYGAFEIIIYQQNEQGIEIKIQMYVPSLCEWNTFFDGFIETETDFDRVMIMLGLN